MFLPFSENINKVYLNRDQTSPSRARGISEINEKKIRSLAIELI